MKVQPRTLSGFMELLPGQQVLMETFLAALRETYGLYGFTPLDTPIIESAEVLLAKGGGVRRHFAEQREREQAGVLHEP